MLRERKSEGTEQKLIARVASRKYRLTTLFVVSDVTVERERQRGREADRKTDRRAGRQTELD